MRTANSELRAIRILRWPFANDERSATGHVKATVTPHGRVLARTIVGSRAGEPIMPWDLTMAKNLNVSDPTGPVYAYPTLPEATKTAAVEFLRPMARKPWVRRSAGVVRRLG